MKALRFLRHRVLSASSTIIQSTSLRTWLVFSDGACEGDETKLGTVGAVLISPEGQVCRYFSEQVPAFLMQNLMVESTHPIFELGLLPVWVALCNWGRWLQHSQCVFYLDNEAAKSALINGATSTSNGRKIIQDFVLSRRAQQT